MPVSACECGLARLSLSCLNADDSFFCASCGPVPVPVPAAPCAPRRVAIIFAAASAASEVLIAAGALPIAGEDAAAFFAAGAFLAGAVAFFGSEASLDALLFFVVLAMPEIVPAGARG